MGDTGQGWGGGAEGTGIVLGEIGKREVSLHITD